MFRHYHKRRLLPYTRNMCSAGTVMLPTRIHICVQLSHGPCVHCALHMLLLLLLPLQVPAPGGWANGSMPDSCLQALENLARDAPAADADAEALRFPLSCSELLADTDRSGQPCSTADCIINSDIFRGAQQHRPLKALVVQLALQQVSSKHGLALDPKFKLPKMAYKGDALRQQRVRQDKRQLVTDVTLQRDEAPSFALPPSQKDAAVAAAAAAAAGAKAAASDVGAAASRNGTASSKHAPAAAGSKQSAGSIAAAAGALGTGSSGGGSWQYSVKCEGKPVSHMAVTVQLPHSSDASKPASSIQVAVCGRQLRVTADAAAAAAGPYHVQLPFAASTAGAEAQLHPGSRRLQVHLPYLSAQQWVQQLVEQAPHAFSQLPVAHSAYTELD
ncbi:pre-RNA processing PIH1/Nop17-domain-containing protein [Scenedesmus sp. NREL 46B-D3]|nr:pre-RNA processing PIH1/Nop17-domain-containing protein [Scenedesmus sp. NREL 46B-D3]